jgi:putative aldouronate transport system substrate-binding protein
MILCLLSSQVFAGGQRAAGGTSKTGPTNAAEANMKLTPAPADPLTLPIAKEKISISYMSYPEVYIVSKMTGYAEMEIFQELERRTNVNIKWREEPFGDHQTKVNLMFSTGEPEDLIFDAHLNFPGGARQLLDDGLIIPLNWYIEHYAPNLKKLLLESNQLLKEISLDDGRIYMFPEIRVDAATRANNGFVLRKDWLDKLGLKAPATIDEWYTVLKAFKEKDPNGNGRADEIPYTGVGRPTEFGSAFGILDDTFFLDGDKVVFSPFAPRYLEYVTTLAKWYAEGLLDPEIFTQNGTTMDAKMTDDRAGSYWGAMAGKLGRYLSARYKPGESAFDLIATSPPRDRDGKYYVVSPPARALVPHGSAVGMNNKYIIETTKWMDYFYSKEGSALHNYGTEGRSYTVQNGREVFTDLILKNPNGLTVEEASVKYAGGSMISAPGFDFGNVINQLKLSTSQQRHASEIWAAADTSRIMPTVFLTASQNREASTIMSDANTYRAEMVNKFIMGQEPLSNFPRFIETFKTMGVEKVVGYYNEAYQRWLHD